MSRFSKPVSKLIASRWVAEGGIAGVILDPFALRRCRGLTPREKLIKIRAKVVWHAKYVTFQMAKVAAQRELFVAIL